jgi:hypothetical protein
MAMDRQRIGARADLDVLGLPGEAPGAIGVDVADRVLVHQAVAVVVEALVADDHPVAHLAGLEIHEQPRVLGILPLRPLAERDLLAHEGDVAVAVQVVEAVLVRDSVPIVIDRYHHGAREVGVGRALEPEGPAVGVDDGKDVEDRAV